MDFPGGTVIKNPPVNAGDAGDSDSVPGSERSPGDGNGNALQYSCLGNIPWTEEPSGLQSTRLQKSQTQLSNSGQKHTQQINRTQNLICMLHGSVGTSSFATPWTVAHQAPLSTEIILSFLRLHPSTAFWTLVLTMMATPFLLRDSCPQ